MINKNTIFILLAGIIALFAGIFVQTSSDAETVSNATSQATFSFADLAGKQHNISEWQGKIRIVNFWATWCPPCLKEIPEFIQMQDEYGEQGLQFIGIAVEDKAPVEQYLKTININYPMLLGGKGGDEGMALSRRLGNTVNALPFSLVLNQQGEIIHKEMGTFTREEILKIILPLIEK